MTPSSLVFVSRPSPQFNQRHNFFPRFFRLPSCHPLPPDVIWCCALDWSVLQRPIRFSCPPSRSCSLSPGNRSPPVEDAREHVVGSSQEREEGSKARQGVQATHLCGPAARSTLLRDTRNFLLSSDRMFVLDIVRVKVHPCHLVPQVHLLLPSNESRPERSKNRESRAERSKNRERAEREERVRGSHNSSTSRGSHRLGAEPDGIATSLHHPVVAFISVSVRPEA